MTSPLVGIVCALKAEARHLGTGVMRAPLVTSLADGTLVTISGMGGAAAAVGARHLLDAGAGALVSFGMAGGLDPALITGRIFLPGEVSGVEGASVATSQVWREGLGAALSCYQPLIGGKLLTSPRAIATVAAKAALFRDARAAAVDMESLAVAEAAAARGMPFIAVRVIVDGATDALPDAVAKAADAAGQLRVGLVVAGMLRSPWQLPALLRLSRRYSAASRSLAAVAHTGRQALRSPGGASTAASPS